MASDGVRDAVARKLASQHAKAEHQVQRLLQAAATLVDAVGPTFTIDDVVRESGVSRRATYLYFERKERLLLATLEHLVEPRHEAERVALEENHGSPSAQLRAVLFIRWSWPDGQSRTLANTMAWTYPLLRAELPHEMRESRRRTDAAVAVALGECRAAGLLRDELPEVAQLATYLGYVLNGLIRERILDAEAEKAPTIAPDAAGFDSFWAFVVSTLLRDQPVRTEPAA